MRLGFHLSIAGSLRRAVYQAQVLGCQALQIFIQNPRGWKWRPVAPPAIQDFTRARRQAGLGPLVVHLGYLPNLATADPALYALSTERLFRELDLARALEADYLVVHPGHGPLGEASFAQVARALAQAVSQVPPPPLVLLENTAGQGQELGWRFEHLERIITLSGVPLGLCLDTAHALGPGMTWAAPRGSPGCWRTWPGGRDWTRSRSSTSMTPGSPAMPGGTATGTWAGAPSAWRDCGTSCPTPGSSPKPPSWRPRNRTRAMNGTTSWWPGAWCPAPCSCRRAGPTPKAMAALARHFRLPLPPPCPQIVKSRFHAGALLSS